MQKIKPQTESIRLAGHAPVEIGIEGIKTGAFNHIMKPFDPRELVAEINIAWEHRQVMKKGV